MKGRPILAAIIVVAIAAAALSFFKAPEAGRVAIVTNVVDGDTIVVEGGDRVRLLGIDTREKGEPCYEEAKEFLTGLVEMKEVMLEADVEGKDRYARLLRHVWLNETHVNLEIVRQGLAIAYVIEPNVKYRDEIAAAEKEAMEGKVGCLWQP